MTWYVVLSVSTTAGTGNATASVVEAASAQAFQQRFGTLPSQSGVPGETDAGYPTKAEAQKIADAYNKSGAGTGATGAPAPPGAGLPHLPNPFSDVAHALSAFYDVLTNGKMWRSLGWLLLGIVLMLTGIFLLIGKRSPIAAATGLLG